jgi:hypothetical protein
VGEIDVVDVTEFELDGDLYRQGHPRGHLMWVIGRVVEQSFEHDPLLRVPFCYCRFVARGFIVRIAFSGRGAGGEQQQQQAACQRGGDASPDKVETDSTSTFTGTG